LMYALTVGLAVIVAVSPAIPTKPLPEPVEVAEETPSPTGGETTPSGTPPGAVRNCLPCEVSTVEPVMLIARVSVQSWLPEHISAPRSTPSGPGLWTTPEPSPVVLRLTTLPSASLSWKLEPTGWPAFTPDLKT